MQGGKLTRAKWQALGTSVELVVDDGDALAADDGHGLAQARAILERQLGELDRACSRFREDSELMRANARAGRAVRVDPLLIEAIELALRAAELTDGDVDPTVGAALVLAGYDRDMRLLDCISPTARDTGTGSHPALTREPRVRATMLPGWRAVELDRERSTVRIPRGVKLDLGATAKAWAADRAVLAIHAATGRGVLVSLGGDISTAGPAPKRYLRRAACHEQYLHRGADPAADPRGGAGWLIHVTDDHRGTPDASGQTVSIASGGLATSSTTVRRWRHREHTMHHIIDPSTGSPVAEAWRTVSVAAGDCADANIAATAAIVRGERAPEWLTELGLPARLVDPNGDVVTVGGWPGESDAQ
jgi:FAD:protein FMN transferase